MNNKTVIAGGAAVLLAGVLFIIFSSNDDIAEVIQNVESEVAEEMESAELAIEEEPLAGEDQLAAQASENAPAQSAVQAAANRVILGELEDGNVITVAEATLTKKGYVVLYRVNSNGDSALVGKSDLLNVGTHRNIAIQLVAPAIESQAIVAVLHQDNGNGKFEQGSDQYLLNGQLLANDIDVVGVERSDRESRILETQVEAYLETNFKD